jgi:formylglycine-generating enzyme required for sulfatase activity
MACNLRTIAGLCGILLVAVAAPAVAHPGSGIVVDARGYVWFMDTGYGLWQIDPSGHLTAQGDTGGHFLAIDRRGKFEHKHFDALRSGDVEVARLDPTLLVGREYPVTFGSDGAFYFPQVSGEGRMRIMRMAPGEAAKPFADLPPVREIGVDGKPVDVEWIWAIAAGPSDSIYYTEQQAVRRIAPDGTVSTVAENVVVPDCHKPEALKDSRSQTNLYGLDVAADGTVYVAAPGCNAVLKITPDGMVSVVVQSSDRWCPQGVALAGDKLYVLEYDYVASDDRADWYPRVRRLDPDGSISIVAAVDERPEQAGAPMGTLLNRVAISVSQPERMHGAIVHFPIVLFIIGVPLAIFALCVRQRRTPRVQLLVLFLVIMIFSSAGEWSGEMAERQIPYGAGGVPGASWEYLHEHTSWASLLSRFAMGGALLTAVALMPANSRATRGVQVAAIAGALGAALGGSATAIITAHYGGELVYGQGLGGETLRQYLEEKSKSNRAVTTLAAAQLGASIDETAAAALDGAKAGDQRTIAGTDLCWCPPGRYDMGSPPGELERRPFEYQVTVTLTKGFWIGKYEVTQGDWKRVVGKLPGPPTEELPLQDDLPVGNVNFAEAESYCAKLTELAHASSELPAGWEFRLPTEAQWEYACRAGTTTPTSFGDSISSKQANIKGEPAYNGAEVGPTLGKAAKVGSYPANPWGIHDMHGNTVEWCRDWFHWRYPGGVDPDLHDAQGTATRNGTGDYSRSRRGSCWADPGWPSRSAFRQRFEPERRYDHIGFRVVLVRI